MIRFAAGNLLYAEEEYIAQGVAEGNQEGLGTGLAHEITKRWPDVQALFKKHARSGRFRGGSIWVCPPAPDRFGIVYLATQPDMYRATVPYLRKSLRKLAQWAVKEKPRSVGLPKIGAGLGKLSWTGDVRPLMIEHLAPPETLFVVYETYLPEG